MILDRYIITSLGIYIKATEDINIVCAVQYKAHKSPIINLNMYGFKLCNRKYEENIFF